MGDASTGDVGFRTGTINKFIDIESISFGQLAIILTTNNGCSRRQYSRLYWRRERTCRRANGPAKHTSWRESMQQTKTVFSSSKAGLAGLAGMLF